MRSKPVLLVVCFLVLSSFTCAQKLAIPELIKLRYMKSTQADSFLIKKGYKVSIKDNEGIETRIYKSVTIENDLQVSRSIAMSYQKNNFFLLLYGVHDRKEIEELKKWLTNNKYELLSTRKRTNDVTEISYGKGEKMISVLEDNKPGTPDKPALYSLSINYMLF